MDEAKVEDLLKHIQDELESMKLRLSAVEASVEGLRKYSSTYEERISKSEGKLFQMQFDMCKAVTAPKLLEIDIQSLERRLTKLSEAIQPPQ